MKDIKIPSLAEIQIAASELLDRFPDKKIFALYGEMGVGKTTYIKALCKCLQVKDKVSSPSFGLIHEYRINDDQIVFHFDFYRIEKIEEIYDIGYEDYFYSGNHCFIEWPEIAESLLPDRSVKLQIKVNADHSRSISLRS